MHLLTTTIYIIIANDIIQLKITFKSNKPTTSLKWLLRVPITDGLMEEHFLKELSCSLWHPSHTALQGPKNAFLEFTLCACELIVFSSLLQYYYNDVVVFVLLLGQSFILFIISELIYFKLVFCFQLFTRGK